MLRECDYCKKKYKADTRNIKRGWGLCCSKSCAASKREKSKPGYDPRRVIMNNARRDSWNVIDENEYGVYRGRRTSEGYKMYERGNDEYVAIDKYGDPVYNGRAWDEDDGDSEYWDHK